MELKEVEIGLFDKLAPFFGRYGFEPVRAYNQFRRPTEVGFQNMILAFSAYEEETWVEAFVGVRHDQVEELAYPFTSGGYAFRKDSTTLVTSLGKLRGQTHHRFKIQDERGLSRTVRDLQDFMVTDGLEFVERYTALHELDALFNDDPHRPCPYVFNQAHRCFRGLVMARLVARPGFAALCRAYRTHLTTNAALQGRFNRLAQFLQTYSPN
ncbi:MAG: hypothetical protein WBA12_08970 [Catalinimonas sp.]